MLLLDEMELTQEKLKGTPRPKEKKFSLRKDVIYKQAVVKMLSTLNHKNIDFAAFYIAQHSENFTVKDEKGNEVKVEDILREWKKYMSKDEKSQEAVHYSFSIDEAKINANYDALEKSVVEVLKHNFYEHRYMYQIHKHQGKPHVHVIINKRSKLTNKKMHFKNKSEFKDFFKNLRNEFAENLNHHNTNFNYKSEYKVERDLKYQMLKKTIQDLNKKMNLNSNIIAQAKDNIKEYKSELEDIEKRIDINSKEKIDLTDSTNKKRDLEKVTRIIKRNKELNRIKSNLQKNITKQEILIKNTKFIIKEAATKKFVDVEHTIKFFESNMNKRNMTLSQYFGIDKLKKDFKELKHFYNIKVAADLKTEKDEIQILSMTTNAFKLYKLYKQAIRREFENESVIKDETLSDTIKDNKKFLEKVFRERDYEVELMQRKAVRTLELLKDKVGTTEYKNKEKELNFLKKERKFIDNVKEYNHNLNRNYVDRKISFHNFKQNIKTINEKTSMFKIQNIINEKEYLVANTKNKTEIEYLGQIDSVLKKAIDTRALKNYRTNNFFKKELKEPKTIKNKTEIIKTLEFLKKEKVLINKMYEKYINAHDRKSYLSELEQSLNDTTKESSIYKLIEYQEEITFRNKIHKDKTEIEYLEQIDKVLKKAIDTRAFRNYQISNILKTKYKEEKDKDVKVKILDNIKFINTEKDTIKIVYDKTFDTVAKKELINQFENSVKAIDQSKSIYTIKIYDEERKFRIKFNVSDKVDSLALKEIKDDIKFKVVMREDKVKRSIDYYTNQIAKDIGDKEIKKINDTLEFMKKENKEIRKFKLNQAIHKNKDIEIER